MMSRGHQCDVPVVWVTDQPHSRADGSTQSRRNGICVAPASLARVQPSFPLHRYRLVKTCIDLYELSCPAQYQCRPSPLCDGGEARGRCPGDAP
eukprot:281540-Prymnesium_polylepis.1